MIVPPMHYDLTQTSLMDAVLRVNRNYGPSLEDKWVLVVSESNALAAMTIADSVKNLLQIHLVILPDQMVSGAYTWAVCRHGTTGLWTTGAV